VFPLPITFSETNGFGLFNEWQCPNAPFITTSLETNTDKML
jgi:hypothetical protein